MIGRRIALGILLVGLSMASVVAAFETRYQGRVYPNVYVGGVPFGGKTPEEVASFWQSRNEPFRTPAFEFRLDEHMATISAEILDIGYDATLSATQAYLVGRSGNLATDLYTKFLKRKTDLTPYFRWKENLLDEAFEILAARIDIPEQDALFQFSGGRVTAFRPSREGRKLNRKEAKVRFENIISSIPNSPTSHFVIMIPVDVIKPAITTDQVNSFGIKELLGRGYSQFRGSIAGRVHNIVLAASRLNGLLIKPGATFSFNDAVGDISAATGYQSAYIIKDGRTILGDGGGVCQVSTTFFRAALDAGLLILERHAHSYRVQYYEQTGEKPGLDATVFAPSIDLKVKNDTPAYILIQAKPDAKNYALTFEFYGTRDGRRSEIVSHQVWGISPPPPPLYQDDPTLPAGVVKQVDFAAWGAKASFQYRVTRGGQILQDTTFYSNFQPWRAVYLRGAQ